MMISFIIAEQLPSLNDYINKLKSPNGKHTGAAFKSRIDNICISYMLPFRQQIKKACESPVIIHFEWIEKSKRRDIDNVYSAKKYILDAMQKCGFIENDNYKHIKGVYDGIGYNGTNDCVIVSIIPLEEYEELYTLMNEDIDRLKDELATLQKKKERVKNG